MKQYPIDIVIPWVDGSDPEWRKEKAQYDPSVSVDSSDARYREWGLFRYWFRSVEQYAPWVRTVHFVTWGHVPSWLDVNHPKLNIVKHTDYIPKEYLPTYSSHPIELNMHRIEGLAEHFVYFNDDVYFNQPTKPEDFFVDGVPVDTAVMNMIQISDNFSFMPYIQLNMMGNINMMFSKREVIKKNPKKWFSLIYGKDLLRNLYLLPGKNFAGFRNYHSCTPFCKSTLEEVWETFPKELDNTSTHKFRSREDVNQYFFRYWRLAKGEFVPGKPNNAYLTIGEHSISTISDALNGNKKIVCINDDPSGIDFETEQKKLIALMEAKFPERSSFEKEM